MMSAVSKFARRGPVGAAARYAAATTRLHSAVAAPASATPSPNYSDPALPASEVPTISKLGTLGTVLAMRKFPDENGVMRSGLDNYNDLQMWKYFHRTFGKESGMYAMPFLNVGTIYVVHDPVEFMKVVRAEGKWPHGALVSSWPFKSYLQKRGRHVLGMFEANAVWKKYRMILQKDLISPKAARGYMQAVAGSARQCAGDIRSHADDLTWFTGRASFDMFSTVLFGTNPRTCGDVAQAHPLGLQVCEGVEKASAVFNPMFKSPIDALGDKWGFETKNSRTFAEGWDMAFDNGLEMIRDFVARRDRGELTDLEKRSYVAGLLQREEADDAVSLDEAVDLCALLLSAAVDTTSSLMNWLLVNLAMNQNVQDKLRAELTEELRGGDLTTEVVSSGKGEWLPYFHAIMKESHRMTPSLPSSLMRKVEEPLTLCGFDFPANSHFMLDGYAAKNDPALVPDHKEFRPERWLKEEVEAREGTAAAVIDHPLWRAPFSAGARMCPGSRVANLEVFAFVARVVQDYKLELDGVTSYDQIRGFMGTTHQPSPMPKFKITPLSR